jgi:hypothetical protein
MLIGVLCAFQLDFPGVKIEAVKVVGSCKASTPNQLITYFDESHIDLNNIADTRRQDEAVDIKVTQRSFSHRPKLRVISVFFFIPC